MKTTGVALWEVTGGTIVPPVRVAAQSETSAIDWARHVYSRKYTQARFVEDLDGQPDFVGGAPNYDKFAGWEPERVLVWLNVD